MTISDSTTFQERARPLLIAVTIRGAAQRLKRRRGKRRRKAFSTSELGKIDALRIGHSYQTTYGTLWKDGTYFPRGTSVMVAGLHLDQGFCVRFPAEVDGEPLETWEDWDETEFLAEAGTIENDATVSTAVLAEAREVLDDADDGTHLHLHESDDS